MNSQRTSCLILAFAVFQLVNRVGMDFDFKLVQGWGFFVSFPSLFSVRNVPLSLLSKVACKEGGGKRSVCVRTGGSHSYLDLRNNSKVNLLNNFQMMKVLEWL